MESMLVALLQGAWLPKVVRRSVVIPATIAQNDVRGKEITLRFGHGQ